MVTDVSGYWTAAVSIALSACALTQGCYVHFDLAYSEEQSAHDRLDSGTLRGRTSKNSMWTPTLFKRLLLSNLIIHLHILRKPADRLGLSF